MVLCLVRLRLTFKYLLDNVKTISDLKKCSGVAYSKHIVHLYSYHGGDDLRNHLEVLI